MPLATSIMRSLTRLIQARFNVTPSSWHIRSHQGEPGNELVDALAGDAARNGGTHDVKGFLETTLDAAFVSAMEWTWMLFEQSYRPLWESHCIGIPRQPGTTPGTRVMPDKPQSVGTDAPSSSRATFSLSLGTCNVLTLKSAECKNWGLDGVARQDCILEQFHAQQVNILALQETRLRKLYRTNDPRFVLVKSAASDRGCYGIVLGLSKKNPHGWKQSASHRKAEPIYFHESHVSVIATEPRILIIRLKTPVLRCIVIAAHAPHTGHADDEVSAWWQHVSTLIPPRYNEWPRILLCDANARLGSVATQQVGNYQAETETAKSDFFRTFLCEQGLWLPSTFEAYQKGPGGTWCHTNGSWLRGDYIGVPVQWAFTDCHAFVSEQIDVSTVKEDHRAAIVQFNGPCQDPRLPQWSGAS